MLRNKDKNKKVVFVLEHFWPHIGGAERLFSDLCSGLAGRGHDILVVTTRLRGYKKYEEWGGVKIYRVNCFNRYGFTVFSLWTILKLARNADIIHTTTFNAALPAWFVAKLLGKPCFITVLEVWGNFWREIPGCTFFHRLFEKFIMALDFDKYIAISQFTKKQLYEIYDIDASKIEVIYPGVDYNLFDKSKYDKKESREILGFNQNDFLYLYFGRPGWAKGVEYLLKAVPEIAHKIPNSKLILILSSTPERNYRGLIELIGKLDIKNKIILLNPVSTKDLPLYISASDCVVSPSIAEGFGFMVAEACAMGVPVAVTNAGSLPEVASGKMARVATKDTRAIANGVYNIWQGKWQEILPKKFELTASINGYENCYYRRCN